MTYLLLALTYSPAFTEDVDCDIYDAYFSEHSVVDTTYSVQKENWSSSLSSIALHK